jgi:GT2 family glycosyltransferase
MNSTVPVAVIIPTYNRGMAVCSVLKKIRACDPTPSEIWVHIDLPDGMLEQELKQRFPEVGVLTSQIRVGPGGGRHRCLSMCTTPFAVSFDDDSYPVDGDFFSCVERILAKNPKAAIVGASIWRRNQPAKVRTKDLIRVPSYIGCGHAIRLSAYRQVRGYLARPLPYGIEETDLSLQLFVAGWQIYEAGDLRVFHDTDLRHHESPEITSASITNVGLFAFLHYPVLGWGWGLVQMANIITTSVRLGRIRGIFSGILRIPCDCYRCRRYRKPVAWGLLRRFLEFRRTGIVQ